MDLTPQPPLSTNPPSGGSIPPSPANPVGPPPPPPPPTPVSTPAAPGASIPEDVARQIFTVSKQPAPPSSSPFTSPSPTGAPPSSRGGILLFFVILTLIGAFGGLGYLGRLPSIVQKAFDTSVGALFKLTPANPYVLLDHASRDFQNSKGFHFEGAFEIVLTLPEETVTPESPQGSSEPTSTPLTEESNDQVSSRVLGEFAQAPAFGKFGVQATLTPTPTLTPEVSVTVPATETPVTVESSTPEQMPPVTEGGAKRIGTFSGDASGGNVQASIVFSNTNQTEGTSQTAPLDIRLVGDQAYYVMQGAANPDGQAPSQEWLASPKEQFISQEIADFLNVHTWKPRTQKATFIGSEKINNQTTRHFNYTITARGTQENDQSALVDIWYSKRPEKIKIEQSVTQDSVTLTLTAEITFSNWNTAVAITAPEQSVTGGGQALTDVFSQDNAVQEASTPTATPETIPPPPVVSETPVVSEAHTRDVTRKADLKTISDALSAYYAKVGAYPDTDDSVHQANDPRGVLSVLVEKGYLKALPNDPQSPTYYYGYRSDGTGYSLSSVLEDTSDTSGKTVGNYFIYRIEK